MRVVSWMVHRPGEPMVRTEREETPRVRAKCSSGSPVAARGIYHYMDPENQIGCHGLNAPQGNYEYAFWCEDVLGQKSNTATLTIVRP